ncbi:MAG: M23 family metallopeptidase [Tahibacter sp.]
MNSRFPQGLSWSGSFLVLIATVANAGPTPRPASKVVLPKQARQGELVIGHAPSGSTIEFSGRPVRVGSDGVFVFGLDRDAPDDVSVTLRLANGNTEIRHLRVESRNYRVERVNGLPQHTVTPDPALAQRIAEEQARVAAARVRDDDRDDFSNGFLRPASGRISGVFGSQRIDNGVAKSPHMGLDIAVPTGTPVLAPAAGIVSFVAEDLVLTGGTILIDHGHGVSSSFLHLSRIEVKLGEAVRRGQHIGASGATGRASGPHLHWGLNWFEVRLDPELLPPVARR